MTKRILSATSILLSGVTLIRLVDSFALLISAKCGNFDLKAVD
jgi:hypothetical protein